MQALPLGRQQPALTSLDDCRALLAACHPVASNKMVLLASRFLALTAVRLDAVRGMRWGEIENDNRHPLWRVPASRMKLSRAKKGDARFDHLVPLGGAAEDVLIAALREQGYNAHSEAPADGLVFTGREPGAPIGEGAIGALYRAAGFVGRHVPHGWRASFSTILNEQLGPEWRSAIDQALAHSPKDKVEAAYNRAQQLGRRREIFDMWNALLTD
jgi:integrase